MGQVVESVDVLTLDEAAAFLRVSQEAVMRLVVQQALPGRQIEGQWRFLRAALADWLREKSGKAVLLSQAGAFADDESLAELRAAIYKDAVGPRLRRADASARRRHAHSPSWCRRSTCGLRYFCSLLLSQLRLVAATGLEPGRSS